MVACVQSASEKYIFTYLNQWSLSINDFPYDRMYKKSSKYCQYVLTKFVDLGPNIGHTEKILRSILISKCLFNHPIIIINKLANDALCAIGCRNILYFFKYF